MSEPRCCKIFLKVMLDWVNILDAVGSRARLISRKWKSMRENDELMILPAV